MNETLKLPRVDIQALRGLAVLMVVLYHTKIGDLNSGCHIQTAAMLEQQANNYGGVYGQQS